jgi:rod shape-determining protein MreC
MLSRGPGQSRFTLAVLAVISITIIAIDLLGVGPVDIVRDGVNGVLSPVRAVGNAVFGSHDSEREQELQARIDELEANEIEAANYLAELRRLQATLNLDLPEDIRTVSATIISDQVGNFEDTIEIDQGANRGIEVNMPVTSGSALVGVVDSVTFQSARIRLITDPSINVGVKHVETGEVGIAHGQGDDEPLVIESGFGFSTTVEEGGHFVTAGRNGSHFPPDLVVGTAVRVDGADNPLEKRVYLEPTADLDALSQVVILLYTPSAAGPADEEDGAG